MSSAPEKRATAPNQSAGPVAQRTAQLLLRVGEEGRAAAHIGRGVVAQLRRAVARQLRRALQRPQPGREFGGIRQRGLGGPQGPTGVVAARVLAAVGVVRSLGQRRAGVREMHRPVAAGDTRRASVRVPPGLQIRHTEQHALRYAVLGGSRGELALERPGSALLGGGGRAGRDQRQQQGCGRHRAPCPQHATAGASRARGGGTLQGSLQGRMVRGGACGVGLDYRGIGCRTIRQSHPGGGNLHVSAGSGEFRGEGPRACGASVVWANSPPRNGHWHTAARRPVPVPASGSVHLNGEPDRRRRGPSVCSPR